MTYRHHLIDTRQQCRLFCHTKQVAHSSRSSLAKSAIFSYSLNDHCVTSAPAASIMKNVSAMLPQNIPAHADTS